MTPDDQLARTSLRLGALAFFFGPLTGFPAIALGVIARSRARRAAANGGAVEKTALGGIILGAAGSLLIMVLLVVALPSLGRFTSLAGPAGKFSPPHTAPATQRIVARPVRVAPTRPAVQIRSAEDALAAAGPDDPAARHEGLLFLRSHAPALDPATKTRAAALLGQQLRTVGDRRLVLQTLDLFPEPANTAALLDYLHQPLGDDNNERSNRDLAIRVLGKLKDPAAAPALAAFISDPYTRSAAAEALTELGAAGEDALLPVLPTADPATQREICVVLKNVGTAKSLPALTPLIASSNDNVHRAAQSAIHAIQTRAGIPPAAATRPL